MWCGGVTKVRIYFGNTKPSILTALLKEKISVKDAAVALMRVRKYQTVILVSVPHVQICLTYRLQAPRLRSIVRQ